MSLALGGAAAVFVVDDPEARKRAAAWVAVPGVAFAWLFGFFLAFEEGVSLLSAWILGGLATSFLSLQGTMYFAAKPGRSRAISACVSLVFLVATVSLMVAKPDWE